MYLFSYVALRYMYTFFIIITCILSKFLLYDFQVLIYNIYNQTVLPFNVLLSFQEIFLPTVVLYSMLYTWIYKRSDASSAHISSNILIVVLHSKCEEFWYSSIIFKRIFWIHCYLNCCAKLLLFFFAHMYMYMLKCLHGNINAIFQTSEQKLFCEIDNWHKSKLKFI